MKRNDAIDILKGIGIVLMVAVHGGCPLNHFINLFHMPIFFVASGYLWNEENSKEKISRLNYCKRKMKSLYIPFVLFNSLLVILNNFFIYIHFYTTNKEILLLGGESNVVSTYKSIKGILFGLVKLVFMIGKPQLGSPTWFISCLLFISISYMYFCALGKTKKRMLCIHLILLVIIILGICFFCKNTIKNSLGFQSWPAAYLSYLIGVGLKRLKKDFLKDNSLILFLISSCTMIFISFFGSISLSSGKVENPFYFAVCSIFGFLMIYSFANILPNALRRVLVPIGKHSMSILLFHLIAFKFVNYIYVILTKKDMIYVALFPRIESEWYLWICYTIIGVGLPLIFVIGKNIVEKKFFVRGNKK